MGLAGAHVSTAGGWDRAVDRAVEIGAEAMQIFTGSPRMWRLTDPDKPDYQAFGSRLGRSGVRFWVIHATYLVNLASDKPELVEKSRLALSNDMEICGRGGFGGVVVHLGSHQGRGFEAVREQLVRELKVIVGESGQGSVLLIENSAGQKGKIGSDLEEIRYLLDGVGSERLGWCLDTCHAHAAGYSLVDLVGREMDRLKLWEGLGVVHVNESKDALGSGRDRHENLGQGTIGTEALGEFLSDERFRDLPLILEVPGMGGSGPDRANMDRLKSML